MGNNIGWNDLKNYIGYIVNVDNVYGILSGVRGDMVRVLTKDGYESIRCMVSVKVYSMKEGYSSKNILTTTDSVGFHINKIRDLFEELTKRRCTSKSIFAENVSTEDCIVGDTDKVRSFSITHLGSGDTCLKFTMNVGLKRGEVSFLMYENDIFVGVGKVPESKDSVEIYQDYISTYNLYGKKCAKLVNCDSCVYVSARGYHGFSQEKLDMLVDDISGLDDDIDLINISLKPMGYVCKVVNGVLSESNEDVTKYIDSLIGVALHNSDALDIGECDLAELEMLNRLTFIEGIKPIIPFDEWFESDNGVLYCASAVSTGVIFCFIVDVPVLSARGIELYRDLVGGFVKPKDGTSIKKKDITRLGSYRDESEREEILKVYNKVSVLAKMSSVDKEIKSRLCRVGLSYKDYHIVDISDGLNMLSVDFVKESVECTYRFSVMKGNKNKIIPVDLPIGFSKNDVLGLLKLVYSIDKDILKPIEGSKFVIYNYDGLNVKIDSSTAVDTCYCFSDCLKICNKRKGDKFLVVEFTNDSIGSQWEVLCLSSKCPIIRKIA